MRQRIIEIAVPTDLLREVDRLAQKRGDSRDQFVTRVLRDFMRLHRDAEVTRRLNELFSEPDLSCHQKRLATELEIAGSDWNDESW